MYNVAMPSIKISELPATEEVVHYFRQHFTCQRCGACCTEFDGVKLTKDDIKRLGVPKNEQGDTFMLINGTYYMKEPCRFYDAARGECTIYERRPQTCANFPLRTVSCTDGLLHLAVSETCPAALETLAEVEVEWLGR
jgi:Fe-S-cluster containining protein